MSLKQADYGSVPTLGNISIGDLISAIGQDYGINSLEKVRLLAELKRTTGGAPNYSPLSNFMYGAFGTLFGNLIAKYFGMGTIGRGIATLAGAGIGSAMYNRLTDNNTQSWRSIR